MIMQLSSNMKRQCCMHNYLMHMGVHSRLVNTNLPAEHFAHPNRNSTQFGPVFGPWQVTLDHPNPYEKPGSGIFTFIHEEPECWLLHNVRTQIQELKDGIFIMFIGRSTSNKCMEVCHLRQSYCIPLTNVDYTVPHKVK